MASKKNKKNQSVDEQEVVDQLEDDAGEESIADEPVDSEEMELLAEDPEKESEAASAERKEKVEKTIKTIIQNAKKKGFLTYEELNDALPDEIISPARLDSLLMTFDEMGIQLLDEADAIKDDDDDDEFEGADKIGDSEAEDDDLALEATLTEQEGRKIDDPIRMYLTQMGEIPLLTREEEINLARKIDFLLTS